MTENLFFGGEIMSTWVVGDIHGCYSKFKKLLKNEEIKEDDTIILIGDIIDRGPDSYKMIKWAMKNVTPDGRYQMVLGNHEDNIIRDYDKLLQIAKYRTDMDLEKTDIINLNTHYDFCIYMYAAGFGSVKSVEYIVDWFRSLPLTKRVEVTTPNGTKQKYMIAHGWYGEDMERLDILWYRDSDRFGNLYDEDYEGANGEILIHGHTPTITINKCMEKPVNEVLFREHSINIDCGCVFSKYGGNLAAIRLEDQKVIYAGRQKRIIE